MANKRNYSRVDRLFTVKEQRKALGFVAVALIGGLGAYLASKGLKNTQSKNYYLNASDPNKAAYYSERLFIAFDGWGTNEDEIYAVLSEIPDRKMWEAVQKIYETEHGEPLMRRMVNELDNEEYKQALTIIKARGLA
jgi:hypothetical protein